MLSRVFKTIFPFIDFIQGRSQDFRSGDSPSPSLPTSPSSPLPSPPLLSSPYPGGPSPLPARGSGERCKLPQRGPGRNPGRKRIFRHFLRHRNVPGGSNFASWCLFVCIFINYFTIQYLLKFFLTFRGGVDSVTTLHKYGLTLLQHSVARN